MLQIVRVFLVLIGALALRAAAQPCTTAYQVVVTGECTGQTNDSVSTVNVTVTCGVDSAQKVMEKAADQDSKYEFTVTYTGLSEGYVVDKLFGYALSVPCEWYVYKDNTSLVGNFYNRTASRFIVNQGQVVLLRYGIYRPPTAPPTTAPTTVRPNAALSIHDRVFASMSLFAASVVFVLLQY